MLTVLGPRARFCDGVAAAAFLRSVSLGVGGLTLPQLLRAEAARAGRSRTSRSSWSTCPAGWPTRTRSTSSPTPRPRSAASSSRSPRTCPASRSASSCRGWRSAWTSSSSSARSSASATSTVSWQSITGYPMDAAKREGKPHFGSVVARMQGQTDPVDAGVRRPVPDDAAQAVQHARRRRCSAAPPPR